MQPHSARSIKNKGATIISSTLYCMNANNQNSTQTLGYCDISDLSHTFEMTNLIIHCIYRHIEPRLNKKG